MRKATEEVRRRIDSEKALSGTISTGQVRAISSSVYRDIEDKSLDHVLALSEELLQRRDWAQGVVAYDWAFRVRNQYTARTFRVFEHWLKTYVTGWGSCDDFCTHAMGALLSRDNERFESVMKWTDDPNFCVRRAAAVSLIYPIRKDRYDGINPFAVSDALMGDDHHLVLKGYGWMLKVLSQQEPGRVFDYLKRNSAVMPRVSFRYALEKLRKEDRDHLMGL